MSMASGVAMTLQQFFARTPVMLYNHAAATASTAGAAQKAVADISKNNAQKQLKE